MLDWRCKWIQEILQRTNRAMAVNELYDEVGKTFGICTITSALYDLEALNMVVAETNNTWRIK